MIARVTATASATASGGMRAGAYRQVEDVITVRVLDCPVVRERTVEAARGHHRELEHEVDDPLEHRGLVADQAPHRLEVERRGDAVLALAVVAEGRGLEDRRQADPLDGGGQLLERLHRLERRDRKALQAQERLLARPLLA